MSFIDQNVGNGWNGGTNGFPFNGAGRPSINTAFNQALSDYELICMIRADVDKLINYIDNFESTVLYQAKNYTDDQVNLSSGILDSKITANTNAIQAMRLKVDEDISALYLVLNKYQSGIDNRIDSEFVKLKQYIDETVSNISRLYVTNPRTGKLDSIQNVIDDIYRNSQVMALTCWEWDSMQLRADSSKWALCDASSYENKSRFIFFTELYLSMSSPLSGLRTDYGTLISQLFDLHKTGLVLTATQYDAKHLTATQYDNKLISATSYDWNSKTLLA